MTSTHSTTRRRDGQGFTLVELLVVIAIIALLAGLLLGGVAIVKQGAKESQARTVLGNLMGNAGQYESKFPSAALILQHMPSKNPSFDKVDWTTIKRQNAQNATGQTVITGADLAGDDNGDYTYSNGDTNDQYMERANLYMNRFIWTVNQMPVIRNNLPSLGAALGDFDDDGFLDVIDPWGNPVAFAVRVSHDNELQFVNDGNDDDFLPAHDNPFFASAGKDQRWGRPRVRGEFANDAAFDTYKQTDDYKFSVDNLYSFDIDRSAAQRGD